MIQHYKMKTIKLFQASLLLAVAFITAGCSNDEATNNGWQDNTYSPTGAVIFSGETSTSATTRTTIVNHVQNAGANVNWTATDKVWVKDDANTWRQSAAATFLIAANKANATFALSGTYTGATHDVLYTNKAITGTPQVEIKAAQSQTTPNNFDHAGESGDYGIATATRQGAYNTYKFTLTHKVAYLCFLPRCMNVDLGKNIYLTKVTITADKPIAGTFNITNGSIAGNAPVANSSNTITLTTNNFPLNTTVAEVTKNAAYIVIAPGTYNFTIGYTIKDPTTNVEGTITKKLTGFTCTEGNISDITAWVEKDIKDYSECQYYMWDAQKYYWFGYEWNKTNWQKDVDQPILNGNTGSSYPKTASDIRWYNTNNTSALVASRSAKDCPNANEISWYLKNGDGHWDTSILWSTMGHLYRGGMWFLKKSKITGFRTDRGFDNSTDFRITAVGYDNFTIPQTRPSNTANYFYMPALGVYVNGKIDEIGKSGRYWSSTGYPGSLQSACDLYFSSEKIHLGTGARYIGYVVKPFSYFGND